MKWLIVLLFLCGCAIQPADGDEMEQWKNGWSQPATLGYLGRGTGPQAKFDYAHEFTVQFRVDGQLTTANGVKHTPNPVATISYSVAGNTVKRKVSATNGMSISGNASTVMVELEDATVIDTGAEGAVSGTYQIVTTISPGSRPSQNQPPTFTPNITALVDNTNVVADGTGFIELGPGASVTVDIPAGVGVISQFVTADPFPQTNITSEDLAVFILDVNNQRMKVYDPRGEGWVPVPPTATKVTLKNNSTVSNTNCTINFSLTFGIDG